MSTFEHAGPNAVPVVPVAVAVAAVPVAPALPSLGELTEEEVQWLREQDRIRSASTVTPVTPVPAGTAAALDLKDMQEKATAENTKRTVLEQQQQRQREQDTLVQGLAQQLHSGVLPESLHRYGDRMVALALAEQGRTVPTLQQAHSKYRARTLQAKQELGRTYKAIGHKPKRNGPGNAVLLALQ